MAAGPSSVVRRRLMAIVGRRDASSVTTVAGDRGASLAPDLRLSSKEAPLPLRLMTAATAALSPLSPSS